MEVNNYLIVVWYNKRYMNSKLKELNQIINSGKINRLKIENMMQTSPSPNKTNSSLHSLRKEHSDRKTPFKPNKRLESAKTYLKEGNGSIDTRLNYMINIENIH